MKFCWSTLFEARYIQGKQAWFWQLKPYFNSFRHIWRTLWPTSVLQNRRELSCSVYMRRINYDSATVNISVFIEKRNISFQNYISLKTMRLGVLSWEKLKNLQTHGRIVSLDQPGSRKVIADLFIIFITWTSQKSSKVHKLLSQSWP